MSDRVTVNVGGRRFETTSTTLLSCESSYFAALLGDTGRKLSGRKRARGDESESEAAPRELFLDRDPSLFEVVLQFMRSGGALPAATRVDLAKLEDLRAEGEFLCFEGLVSACEAAAVAYLENVKEAAEAATPPEEDAQHQMFSIGEAEKTIEVPEGQVLYIVSATMAGRNCQVRRFTLHADNEKKRANGEQFNIPNCYLAALSAPPFGDGTMQYDWFEHSSGDFQLLAKENVDQRFRAIAHVGLDQVNCGNIPLNMQFRQDLRICLGGDDVESVTLRATGSAIWHLVTWIGHPHKIPGLIAPTAAPSYSSTKESDDLTLALVAAATTSNAVAVAAAAAAAMAAIMALRRRRARR